MELTAGIVMGAIIALVAARALGYLTARAQPATDPRPLGPDDVTTSVHSAMQSLDIGIVVYDDLGREIYRNPAAEFTSMTRPTQAVVNGEIHDYAAALMASASDEATAKEVDLFGPPPISLVLRGRKTSIEGRDGQVVIVHDVTKERNLQAIRTSFVSNVSHELRTPVGAIAVLGETMTGIDDPDTLRRLGGRVSHAAIRLGDMIEDLLELSRTESAEADEHEPVLLADVVATVAGNLAESAEAAQLSITTTVTPTDLSVMGDRRQLRSALQNLVDNAIKYSEPGGEIQVSAIADCDSVLISVADEGIGIPTTDLDRVFERFYRVDAARRRETGGTGLGLSIVRHVALNHGGDVAASSTEGEGSTFTLRLPNGHPRRDD